MVNRDNYLLTLEYLDHLRRARQLDEKSVQRYRFYLRHLLLWADDTPLSQAARLKLPFPEYLRAARSRSRG